MISWNLGLSLPDATYYLEDSAKHSSLGPSVTPYRYKGNIIIRASGRICTRLVFKMLGKILTFSVGVPGFKSQFQVPLPF